MHAIFFKLTGCSISSTTTTYHHPLPILYIQDEHLPGIHIAIWIYSAFKPHSHLWDSHIKHFLVLSTTGAVLPAIYYLNSKAISVGTSIAPGWWFKGATRCVWLFKLPRHGRGKCRKTTCVSVCVMMCVIVTHLPHIVSQGTEEGGAVHFSLGVFCAEKQTETETISLVRCSINIGLILKWAPAVFFF